MGIFYGEAVFCGKLQTQLIMCAHAHARSIYAHGMCESAVKYKLVFIVTLLATVARPSSLACVLRG